MCAFCQQNLFIFCTVDPSSVGDVYHQHDLGAGLQGDRRLGYFYGKLPSQEKSRVEKKVEEKEKMIHNMIHNES